MIATLSRKPRMLPPELETLILNFPAVAECHGFPPTDFCVIIEIDDFMSMYCYFSAKGNVMKDLSGSKASASSELANRIFFRLYQAANTMHKTGTKALEKYGVTTQQWSVLGALSRPQAANGMAIGDLCRFLMVSRQNLNGVLDRLGRQGYTTAVTDAADRRSKRIKLTPKGEKVWDAITPLIYSYYDNTLQGFSFDDRVDFLHHLNHLLNNMVKLED